MITFRHHTTIMICGPTQCWKTFFFKQILANSLIHQLPTRIINVNGDEPPELKCFPNIEYVIGIQNFLTVYYTVQSTERNLIVIDDQMNEAGIFQQ